ncbi:ribosomal RNA small subunit methyltransferase A [Candidatus Nomurabacteria bacterium]|nr:ribosomal RNA small subunit methyltransferase A [Candidatus Nomurabacteria bacterium]
MDRFETKKSLGQNFLNSKVVPEWLCDAGEVVAGDLILEIGPGTGALTEALLSRGARVLALEADLRAIEILKDKFKDELKSGQLSLEHTDVRELDLAKFGLQDHSFKVVANIPYYLTGFLFRVLLSHDIQPSTLVFLVQKEVGKRASSNIQKGEKESLLSLSLQAFGDVKYVKTVGRGHFSPSPKVDSAIVLVHNINRDKFKEHSADFFFEILHLGFGSKRKQLLGNLAKKYPRPRLLEIFNVADIEPNARAEDVPIWKWLTLTRTLENELEA